MSKVTASPAHTVTYMQEPELEDVKEEDKTLVKDVLTILHSLQHPHNIVKGWSVIPRGVTHYDIVAQIDTKGGEWEVFLHDLDLVKQVDWPRIPVVSVKVAGQCAQIYVKVMSKNVPIMVEETDIIRVVRKRKWHLL